MELIELKEKQDAERIWEVLVCMKRNWKKSQCLHKLLKYILAGREMDAYFIIDKYRKQS